MMTHMRSITLLLAATSLYAAETVQTPIDNDQVKVLNVVVQPHEKTRLHEHKVNRVMIYLTPGTQQLNYEDGHKVVIDVKGGDVKWSPASGKHIAEITSEKPVNIIEVELKKPANNSPVPTSALDPTKIDKKHYKVLMENDQVRVLRVKIGPHESTPTHEHMLNRVLVYLADQNIRVTTPDGKADTLQHKAGETSWGTPAKHKEENMSDKLFDVVVVELKS
jgi:uncharacterized RmlC-like cupin family protein